MSNPAKSTSGILPLGTAAVSVNIADQIVIALVPLLLAAGGASPFVISVAVAASSLAWLVVSLPIGALADRVSRRGLVQVGGLLTTAGGALGWVFLAAGAPHPGLIAIAAAFTSAGVVMAVLSVFALMPAAVPGAALSRVNARLELGRALAATLAPVLAGALVTAGRGEIGFLLAAVAGLVATLAARGLPAEAARPPVKASILVSIGEGARFVVRQPLLRAIAICAVFWNTAFFALIAVMAPHALGVLGLTVAETARAWSCYGAGLILGAMVAGPLIARLRAGHLFAFGPAMSFLGAALLAWVAPIYGAPATYAALFCFGFGPMIWLVLQTTARQLVTPPDHLGRVAATITTAIYGVRPIGALLAGLIAAQWGTQGAMLAVVALFTASLAAIALSMAVSIGALSELQTEQTPAPAH